MKTIREIMVALPQQCTRNESLKEIVLRMDKSNIGCLPVVDESKKVIGIITDRDVALALCRGDKRVEDLKVHEVMTAKVHTIRPEDHTVSALKMMRTMRVGRLPVVDEEQRLKGMVSLNRILRNNYGTEEAPELEYAGAENILNTLHSIAERNSLHYMES